MVDDPKPLKPFLKGVLANAPVPVEPKAPLPPPKPPNDEDGVALGLAVLEEPKPLKPVVGAVAVGAAGVDVPPKPPKPLEGVEEKGNPLVLVGVGADENDWEKALGLDPGNEEGPLRPFE